MLVVDKMVVVEPGYDPAAAKIPDVRNLVDDLGNAMVPFELAVAAYMLAMVLLRTVDIQHVEVLVVGD
jgi:hypothetical protein